MPVITEIIVIALVVSLILATLRKIYDWICSFFTITNIPSPPAYPLLRHLPYFWHGLNDEQVLCKWVQDFQQEGLFCFDALLGKQRICVFKEEYIKQILVTNCGKYQRSEILGNIFPPIRGGLFLANGQEHAWQRKALNPMFSLSSVLGFVESFESNTDNLIKHWENEMKKTITGVTEVDILKDFFKLTLDIIGETAFGYKFNTLVSGENKVSKAVDIILKGKISVLSRVLERIIPFYDKIPFKQNVEVHNAMEVMKSTVSEIIENKRSIFKKSKEDGTEFIANDLLAKMIAMEELGERFTDEMIQAQIATFMIAGHETTSVGLTWLFYLLAKHPEVQEKTRNEINTVLGNSDAIESRHLDKMQYLTAVINESLRMYPPGALILREVRLDDQLGKYKIPKGSMIVMPIISLHHLETNWKDHDQFIPERFLDEEERTSNYKFMPFSNGPRNCIGRKFALTEMKILTMKLLKAFKFQLDPNQGEISTSLRLTLKPKPNPILRVSLVNN